MGRRALVRSHSARASRSAVAAPRVDAKCGGSLIAHRDVAGLPAVRSIGVHLASDEVAGVARDGDVDNTPLRPRAETDLFPDVGNMILHRMACGREGQLHAGA